MNHDMVYDSLQCLDYIVNMNPLIGYSQNYLSEQTKQSFQTKQTQSNNKYWI